MVRIRPSVPRLFLAGLAVMFLLVQPVCAQSTTPSASNGQVPGLDPQLDPNLTSRTIYATGLVNATTTHPWVGFWKLSCKDEFGLALVAAKANTYSVLFCGPFACSKPGTFLPDTTLVNDAEYRLDNPNQIGVLDRNKKYNIHTRCLALP